MKVSLFNELEKDSIAPESKIIYIGEYYHYYKSFLPQLTAISSFYKDYIEQVNRFLVNLDSFFDDDTLTLSHAFSGNRYLTRSCDRLFNAYVLTKCIVEESDDIIVLVDTLDDKILYHNFLFDNNRALKRFKPRLTTQVINRLKNFKSLSSSLLSKLRELYFVKKFYNKPTLDNNLFISWIKTMPLNDKDIIEDNPYFGGLIKEFSNKSIVAIALDGCANNQQLHQSIAQCGPQITTAMIFAKYRDVISCFFKSIKLLSLGKNKKIFLDGLDCGSIIKASFKSDFWQGDLFKTLIYYSCFKRISLAMPDPCNIFYPFENQPWERALIKAIKDKSEGGRLFAYQFFPLPVNLNIPFFSERNINKKLTPYAILSSDEYSDGVFRKQGLRTIAYGSARYNKLLDEERFSPQADGEYAIAALFLEAVEARSLAVKAIDICHRLNLKLIINYHPMLSPEVVTELLEYISKFNHVSLVKGPLIDYLGNAKVLFYNSSSVCYEASLRGIPIIFIESEGLINLNRSNFDMLQIDNVDDGVKIVAELLSTRELYSCYCDKVYQLAHNELFKLNLEPLREYIG